DVPLITEDSIAPAAPSMPFLDAASDSGTSNTDNITNVTTPVFTGTAEADSTVTIYSDGTEVGSDVADDNGNWSVQVSDPSEGMHSITATATDATGNVSSASGALAITIDATGPIASIGSASADPTNSTIASFALSASDPVAGGVASGVDHLQYSLDGAAFATGSSPVTYPGLAQGTH